MESSMEGLGIALRHEFTFSVAFSQKCDSVYEKTTALSLLSALLHAAHSPSRSVALAPCT